MTDKGSTFRQNPRTAGRVIDGLAFVVTPDDNRLHTLNGTGTRIWELAGDGCTLDDVVAALIGGFTVEREVAERDAARFCEDLVVRGILERT